MQLRYALDDRPPFLALLAFGLQWFAIAIPGVVIIGQVVVGVHHLQPAEQVVYLQKMLFLIGLALFFQVIWGHGLPLILGPSSVLLVGLIASQGFPADTVYSSILVGGVVLALVSWCGLFGHLQKLFTARVVAVVLILIALALAPTVMQLVTVAGDDITPLSTITFSLALTIGMFFVYRTTEGIGRSTLILWALLIGSLLYYLIFPHGLGFSAPGQGEPWSLFFDHLTTRISVQPGILISFLICFFALAINDLGSIQSMSALLTLPDMPKRVKRGIAFTGLANVAAGFLGVLGPVNFSLSPGVIAATGCASRFTLLPAAALLFLLSFSPFLVGMMGKIPPPVIGAVLMYILSYQVASGLIVAFPSDEKFCLEHGLVLGLPLLLGTIMAFLPAPILSSFPTMLRPVLGNGFVVGVLSAILLEHVIFRKSVIPPAP